MADTVVRLLRDGAVEGELGLEVLVKSSVDTRGGELLFWRFTRLLCSAVNAGRASSKGVVVVCLQHPPGTYNSLTLQTAKADGETAPSFISSEKLRLVDCYSDPLGWNQDLDTAVVGVSAERDRPGECGPSGDREGSDWAASVRANDLDSLKAAVEKAGAAMLEGTRGARFSVVVDSVTVLLRYLPLHSVMVFLDWLRSSALVSSVLLSVREDVHDDRLIHALEYTASAVVSLGPPPDQAAAAAPAMGVGRGPASIPAAPATTTTHVGGKAPMDAHTQPRLGSDSLASGGGRRLAEGGKPSSSSSRLLTSTARDGVQRPAAPAAAAAGLGSGRGFQVTPLSPILPSPPPDGRLLLKHKRRNGKVREMLEDYVLEPGGEVCFSPVTASAGPGGLSKGAPKQQAGTGKARLDVPFNLELSEEEKRERARVVLPYEHQGNGNEVNIYNGRAPVRSLDPTQGTNVGSLTTSLEAHSLSRTTPGARSEGSGGGAIHYERDSEDDWDSDEDPDDDLDI